MQLLEKINQLKDTHKAVILAHNYQPGEIQDIADFTGDDHVDLAVRSQDGNFIALLIGHGDGTFLAGLHHENLYFPRTVLGDMNGDGRLDVVAADQRASRISVALSLGDGTLVDWCFAPAGTGVNSAAVALAKLPKSYTSAKAQRELGYSNRPWDDSVRDAWDWFVEHGYARPRRRAKHS